MLQQNDLNEEINDLDIPEYGGEDIDEVSEDKDYGSDDDDGNNEGVSNNSNMRIMQEMIDGL